MAGLLGLDYVFARGSNWDERVAGGADGAAMDALNEIDELGGA